MPRNNNHKSNRPESQPSLEQMLHTNVRAEQERSVARLIALVNQLDLFVLITLNPNTGQPGIAHSRGINEVQLSALLNFGHEYLAKAKVEEAAARAAASVRTEDEPDPGPQPDAPLVTPVVGQNGEPELPPSPEEALPASYEASEGQDLAQGMGG